MNHAILKGKIVSAPKEYGAFTGFEAAAKKLTCEKIRQQMKKVGMKLEIVPINTDYHERIFCFFGLKTRSRSTRYFLYGKRMGRHGIRVNIRGGVPLSGRIFLNVWHGSEKCFLPETG